MSSNSRSRSVGESCIVAYRRSPRRYTDCPVLQLSVLLLSSVLLLPPHVVTANIMVVESGQTFLSQTDKYIGKRLKRGYKYGARLQRIPGNEYLCATSPSSSEDGEEQEGIKDAMWNITRPFDGLSGTIFFGLFLFFFRTTFTSAKPKAYVPVG